MFLTNILGSSSSEKFEGTVHTPGEKDTVVVLEVV
jgi:hypothetical protein